MDALAVYAECTHGVSHKQITSALRNCDTLVNSRPERGDQQSEETELHRLDVAKFFLDILAY